MTQIFKGPAVDVVVKTTPFPTKGMISIEGVGGFQAVIQNVVVTKGERVQEVVTFGEGEHIYTFGKSVDRVTISGIVFIEEYLVDGISSTAKERISTKLMTAWDKMRAKSAGEKNDPQLMLVIKGIGAFWCVGQGLNLTRDLNQEYAASFTLSALVIDFAAPTAQ